ncbi:helix-turn-helix domain-containing protein [Paenibacillus kandeliae]|uniref:helix-turn-helix domain-containing protein n=1 Tax=Paenibacillus kandeliae TaxID=3231269 RepID=UPI0034586F69
MPKSLSIRSIVEQEIQSKGYNLSQFSQISGMNRGTLSLILNGNPSKMPSIPQMDKIAEALGYEQGWLYELYLKECFDREVPHWRRLKNFLYRCLQLGKDHMIQQVLDRVLEDSNQTGAIFDAAEEWYEEGYREQLLPLYQCVIIHERYRHAERLAVSHYRIFRLSQSENFENNLRAAIAFEPYRNELPIGFRLDGLLKLANIYYNQHMWEKVEFFADELRELATAAYENRIHMDENKDGERGIKMERHLVVYYGHGFLLKGNALEEQQRYQEALTYIEGYKDLSWFQDLNEIGIKEVKKFKEFSIANELNLAILTGDISQLDNYVDFLSKNKMELLPGLLTIVTSANKHNFEIDHILTFFEKELLNFESNKLFSESYYDKNFDLDHYTDLCFHLGIYFLEKNDYTKAINNIIISLEISQTIRKHKHVINGLALLHFLRSLLDSKQHERYDLIVKGMLANEEIIPTHFIPNVNHNNDT